LKVLLVSHAFPPYQGGLSNVLYNLAQQLSNLGHQVTVLTLKLHLSLDSENTIKGVKVIRIAGAAPSNYYFIPSPELVQVLSKLDVDVVHVHNIGALTVPITVFFHRLLRRDSRLVVSPHHHEAGSSPHTRFMWQFYKPIARKSLQLADNVHSVSTFESKLLKRDFGTDSLVIPNGISDDTLNYMWNPPDTPVVTYAGRMEEYKRIHVLVSAVSVAEQILGKRIILRLIGNGSYLNQILMKAEEMKVEVDYHDFLARNDYLELLSKSSVFANLSMFEAFSIVAAEALSMNMPSVVAKPWGYNFYGYNVKMVDGLDATSTGKIIAALIENPTRAKKRFTYTWRDVAQEITKRLYT
jgi:glycosyltransferase involved in cell wall biosynthesis